MEKLDLIIAALQRVELLFEAHGQYPHTLREVNEALTAARELRELKPVAKVNSEGFIVELGLGLSSGALLYAFGEATCEN